METLQEKKERALWVAHSLFERGKTSGTTANLSFRHKDRLFVTASGSCFGTLTTDQLVETDMMGNLLSSDGMKPSKELTLHRCIYEAHPEVQAVIHTHGPYAVLWSCLRHENPRDVLSHDTPYLDMKLGKVALIGYATPGSQELFDLMARGIGSERGYLLSHHGGIVGGLSLLNAFEAVEELEQTAWLCWQLRGVRELVSSKEENHDSQTE